MNLDAILILTNQCNLNCAFCIYGCDLNPTPYYISLDELKITLNLMKQKLPSLQKIILSGGDAFMHPQFLDVCKEIRNIFPNIELCAYTNGLLLHKIKDEDIIYLNKQLKLSIVSSLYPSTKNLEEYKKQDARFKSLGTELYYQSSHFYFKKQNYKNININLPQNLVDTYFQSCRTITTYNNLITIYKNKILTCCGEVGYLNNNKEVDLSDLLDLTTLQSEQEILDFCKKPHNICKNCTANRMASDDTVLWSKKNRLTQKYQENKLETIFARNYDDYKQLCLDDKQHLECLNDKFFYDHFLPEVNPGELEYLNIKYKNGLGDIFIPYDSSFNKEKRVKLHEKLYAIKDIDKYNIYFVGIKTTVKYNQIMYQFFKGEGFESKLKVNFLQATSLLNGYKVFLQYSYLNNKILLDVDNFISLNKTAF